MKRILAQTRKEITQLLRDPLALALALVLPLVQVVLLGTGIGLTVSNLPIIVQDLDGSSASRSLVDAFRASGSFYIISWPSDLQPEQALRLNKARAALIIPEHFGRDITRGVNAPVQVLVDASDANTAKLVAGYANEIAGAYNAASAGSPQAAPVLMAIRLWFNPGLSSKKFYGPGIFVMALSLFPPLLATLAMSKEGERKTILQVYVSSISAHEFLLGKILAFMAVVFAESALLLLLLFTYFGLSFAGDPSAFLVATVLYAFCVASFGTMVGAAIPDQMAAMQTVLLGGFLFVFLLSGLLFPLSNIPASLRWISYFVWARYYIEIVRDALLQGSGWTAVWYKVLIIALTGSIFYTLAWRKMRRMQVEA
jgi:ABC-2 type transport system permease protein